MRRKNKETEESGRMIVGRGEKIFRVVNNCFMVLLMLITLYPLLYVLFASLGFCGNPPVFPPEAMKRYLIQQISGWASGTPSFMW